MPTSRLERIRDCIRRGRYDTTAHAWEELAEDLLDLVDVEHAVLAGEISHRDTSDPRGVRYVVIGPAVGGSRRVGVVGRFVERERYLIITVYEVS